MDFELVDCQIESEHLKSLGAFNLSRETFLTKLTNLL
jgi:leucyl/phenylalanyl-tRNA--protein transferase